MRIRNYLATIAVGACIGLLALGALYRLATSFDAASQPQELADLQAANPGSIVLPFDIRYNLAFKSRRMEVVKPDIAWFGTSRAGSVMAGMFKPYTFYNMAFTAWTNDQLVEAFERSTRNVRPRVAVISLDYFLFSDRWESQLRSSREMIIGRPVQYLEASMGNFARAALRHWQELASCERPNCPFIGPQTVLTQEGFREDGSWAFTEAHIAGARQQYRNPKFLIDSLAGAPEMSERQKAPIEEIARIARERNITLIAVQLPYIRAGTEFLDAQQPQDAFFGIWRDFERPETSVWLRSLGIAFFDLGHSSVGDRLDNFIDAYHLSEQGMQAAITELMSHDDFRNALSPHLAAAVR